MNKETTKHIVSLYMTCQKLMMNPKKLAFSSFRALLSPTLTEDEFKKFLNLPTKVKDPFVHPKIAHKPVLIDIKSLANRIKLDTNPNQKLIIMTQLIKLMQLNKEEENAYFDKAILTIGESF